MLSLSLLLETTPHMHGRQATRCNAVDKGKRIEDKPPTLFGFYSASLFIFVLVRTGEIPQALTTVVSRNERSAGSSLHGFYKTKYEMHPFLHKRLWFHGNVLLLLLLLNCIASPLLVKCSVCTPSSPIGRHESVVDQSNELMNPNSLSPSMSAHNPRASTSIISPAEVSSHAVLPPWLSRFWLEKIWRRWR